MEDKAVSTEDLWAVSRKTNVASSLARLEAILQTLLENKAQALRNDNRGKHRKREIPRSILKRFRLTDRPSNVKIGVINEKMTEQQQIKRQEATETEMMARKSALKKDFSTSSAGSHYRYGQSSFEASSTISDEDRFQYDNVDCCTVNDRPPTGCCCSQDIEGQLLHPDEDYASLRLEEEEEEAAARRKRRRRRRRKRRAELARGGYLIEAASGDVAVAVEDSTKKAKWTIVATACLLLFMCLLLVGVTLRMAPIIDEMVRKENAEYINSLSRHRNSSQSSGTSVHSKNT